MCLCMLHAFTNCNHAPKNGVSGTDTHATGSHEGVLLTDAILGCASTLHSVSVRRLKNSLSRTVLRMYPIVE